MKRDSIDLGTVAVPHLFRIYLIPTLLGMLSLCAVTATDGIFVGRGIGSDALAAVNICIAPTMVIMGVSLMLGVGASVVASIHLASRNVKAARLNVSQALLAATLVVAAFLALTLSSVETTGRLLGSSDSLMQLVGGYMPWIFMCLLFQAWCAIGLFVVRLDGSPKYAMWCNVLPGLLNILLDYLFIFPLGMGVRGAGIATCISCAVGGLMVMGYLALYARTLRLIRIKASVRSLKLSLRNIGYQCKIGISALLGEATMGMLMLMGNLAFMRYIGNDGVGAFSIACYYCPFVFMIGNAIAQSAQPIISFNYGMGYRQRVRQTERLAILAAIVCGMVVTLELLLAPSTLGYLLLDEGLPAADI
ncbi:MAG: MATE family efflux transporter, partial [Paramuribaculum sp.]|nr:MATE family efflux transporter [Paramuribaculum sp.]